MAFPSLHGQGHKVRKQAKIRAPRALTHPSNGLRGEELLELLELVSCFLASLAGTSISSTAAGTYPGTAPVSASSPDPFPGKQARLPAGR